MFRTPKFEQTVHVKDDIFIRIIVETSLNASMSSRKDMSKGTTATSTLNHM